mgnify:CR=1 FL=1
MSYTVIGSTAIQVSSPDIKFRKPSDLDIWTCHQDTFDYFREQGDDVKLLPDSIISLLDTECGFATANCVYTIKCSHLGWNNPMWGKHKSDIINLKAQGCTLLPELYKALLSHWKEELGDKSFLSLAQDKKSFFTDNVVYKYDHDYLHELVAHPEKPVYTLCLKDNEDVLIDKGKFDNLPFNQQVKMFREEITVIAVERYLLFGEDSWVKAYNKALHKTITTLTKGWATDFLVLNLDEFVKPNYKYFNHILTTLEV